MPGGSEGEREREREDGTRVSNVAEALGSMVEGARRERGGNRCRWNTLAGSEIDRGVGALALRERVYPGENGDNACALGRTASAGATRQGTPPVGERASLLGRHHRRRERRRTPDDQRQCKRTTNKTHITIITHTVYIQQTFINRQ